MPRRILFLLLPLFFCSAGSAYGRWPEVCEHKLPKDPAYYADMKEPPPGKYGFSYTYDKAQFDDASAPVVLRGLGGISAPRSRAVKLSCVEVENRTARVVRAVQLRWAVSALAPGQSITEKAGALAKGLLPVLQVEVEARGRRKVEVRGVQFADFFQPLAAAGEINGNFNVTLGVARVEYADGTAEDLP
jgi:hypothetical protein